MRQHYNEDLDRSLKLLLNLINQQVYQTFDTRETSQTTKYCQMLGQFFDCLNVRSLEKHHKKTKPFLKPYINENDQRFL